MSPPPCLPDTPYLPPLGSQKAGRERRDPWPRPSQGDQVLVSHLAPNHTDIARIAGDLPLSPEPDPEDEEDGVAIWRNNPIGTALCEVQAIWPSVEEPDFVVSLGTGFQRQQHHSPHMSGTRGILRDGSIPRLYRAFLSSLSGRKLWQEFRNRRRADSKGRYFRFDIGFEGEEPGLDNTSKMQELRMQARTEFSDSNELDDLARSVVASLFYFELEPTPKYRDGKISCAGNILCRLRVGNPALEVLFSQLSKSSARFLLDERALSGAVEDRSFIDRGGNFRKRVEFSLSDRQRKISTSLKEGSHPPNNVSGSPFSVDSLVAAQGMDAHFGRADHKRKQPDDFRSPRAKRRRVTGLQRSLLEALNHDSNIGSLDSQRCHRSRRVDETVETYMSQYRFFL